MPEITAELYTRLQQSAAELEALRNQLRRDGRIIDDLSIIRPGEGIFETKDGLVCKHAIPGNRRLTRFPERVALEFSRPEYFSEIRNPNDGYSQMASVRRYREYRLERVLLSGQVPIYIET